jgi:hypothetical protein
MKISIGVFFVLMLGSAELAGQFKMPSFEVALKGGYVNIGDDTENLIEGYTMYNNYEAAYVQGEINFHVGQHIAAGYFHQRSVKGWYGNSHDSGGDPFEFDAAHLLHGINVRFSTGRSAKFRGYIQVKYFASEFIVDHVDYEVARKGSGVGGGLGVMMRVGHNLYINLLEVEAATLLSDSDVLFAKSDVFPTARIGVTYNFSKRK